MINLCFETTPFWYLISCITTIRCFGIQFHAMAKQITAVDKLTLSERVLCCFMGTMLWYHSYCAGGLASALHSRNRMSPSDSTWD